MKYLENKTPEKYRCFKCGGIGRKLWRQYQTFADVVELLCAECAAKDQGKDISTINDVGMLLDDYGQRTDQIGWLVPAVPTEDKGTYWGYTSVPKDGCIWWRKLPVKPAEEEVPCVI